jgi:hypothetical protein
VLVTLIVIFKPARISQALYDWGQRTSEHPLGWLLLAALIRMFLLHVSHHSPYLYITDIVTIPPMIGHTTVLHLCGFTYGMKGFLIAAPVSLVAATIAFVALRYLFSGVLRSWSKKNEMWGALEAVIVGLSFLSFPSHCSGQLSFRMPKVFPSSFSSGYLLFRHGYIQMPSLQ